MKTFSITKYLVLLAIMTLVACSNNDHNSAIDPVDPGEDAIDSVSLKISVSVKALTRSFITDSYFGDNTSIGVSMMYESGEEYGINNKNVKYTSSGSGSSQNWSSATGVKVTARHGYAVAYYPYAVDKTDLTALPISSEDNIDYMYGATRGVSSDAPQVNIEMKHALSAVVVRFSKNEEYTGSESISNIRLVSNAIGTNAILNALNGTISDIGNIGTSRAFSKTITSMTTKPDDTTTEMLGIIPNTGKKVNMTLSFKCGSTESSLAVIGNSNFQIGKIYIVDVQLRPGKIVVTGLSVVNWEDGDSFEGFMKPIS
jgi:hypothetical protein